MIAQYTDIAQMKTCPRCRTEDVNGFDYGDITNASIPQQWEDKRRGVTRVFKARRCFCPRCNTLWDVILENRIEGVRA